MTQRNFQNARNQGDGPKGKSRKSASSAKLKSKAGASVYAPSKEAKAKRAKQEAKARKNQPVETKANDPVEQQRRRERAMVSMMRDLPEYKFWRRVWWIAMGAAFVVIILTWLPNMLISSGVLGEDFQETASWISTIGFIFAIVALVIAFYIDLRKIRKIQKAQEAKARNLTKTERRELDDAIAASIERDQQRRAERKSKMPWGKKKPQESAEDSPSDQ